MVVGVHHSGGVIGCHLAHAHVQGTIEACGEPFLGRVELMRRNTQVGEDAVHLSAMVELDEILEVLEILRYEGETLVVEGIRSRVLILVEGIEMPRGETLKDGTGVAAAAESDVDIHALGLDVEAFDAFVQHDRIVIHRFFPC